MTSVSGAIFGTTWSVKLVGAPEGAKELAGLLDVKLRSLDAALSTYREDSDLMRLNGAPVNSWVSLPDPLVEVLRISKTVYEESGGAFDPTVGRLVRAWGFGPDPRPRVAPDVAALVADVGFGHLEVHATEPRARWLREGVEIDLSAVAKGYAVDQISTLLTDEGHGRHMVEIGGEVRARGMGPTGGPWRIGVERPDAGTQRAVMTTVALEDRGMATSGDYRNFYQLEGQKVSHTIDPRTGAPVTHHVASVTVLADSAASADAWATALHVLGSQGSEVVASRASIEYMMLVRTDEGFAEVATAGFRRNIR